MKGAFYSALPANIGDEVIVRIFASEIEIFNKQGIFIRRHSMATRKGQYQLEASDRLFNPSRETQKIMEKANKLGSWTGKFCEELFKKHGRLGVKLLNALGRYSQFGSSKFI